MGETTSVSAAVTETLPNDNITAEGSPLKPATSSVLEKNLEEVIISQ